MYARLLNRNDDINEHLEKIHKKIHGNMQDGYLDDCSQTLYLNLKKGSYYKKILSDDKKEAYEIDARTYIFLFYKLIKCLKPK